MADSKPRVLVLGGCGFVGRNLVVYLVKNDLASYIRVCDKTLPVTAWLTAEQQGCFDKEIVDFRQANLAKDKFLKEKVFTDDGNFDYVFNCAAETKASQTPEDYEERVLELSKKCATYAAEAKVKRFVEVSDAAVYSPDSKKKADESRKIEPWTVVANYKAQVEKALAAINGLNYIVVRPCFIYGPSCVNYIMPRLIIGAVYKQLNEKMELLWDKDLRLNTVHVHDVVRAMWHLKDHGDSGAVYNLADAGDTTQGKICNFVSELFGIKTAYMGGLKSSAATKISMKTVCETVNEKHLQPWADMLKEANVGLSPLSPYIDQELLYNKSMCIDGTAIEKTGFKYEHPELTLAACRSMVEDYITLGIFPKNHLV